MRSRDVDVGRGASHTVMNQKKKVRHILFCRGTCFHESVHLVFSVMARSIVDMPFYTHNVLQWDGPSLVQTILASELLLISTAFTNNFVIMLPY